MGALTDVGIKRQFHEGSRGDLQERQLAALRAVRKSTPAAALAEIQGSGGKVVKTSLTHEQEQKLQAALDASNGRRRRLKDRPGVRASASC